MNVKKNEVGKFIKFYNECCFHLINKIITHRTDVLYVFAAIYLKKKKQ